MTKCPKCSFELNGTEYFCPNCGKSIKLRPEATSIMSIIWLLVISVIFVPFGLGKTFRYIRDDSNKAKVVGWLSLFLTTATIIAVIWLTSLAIQRINQQLGAQLQTLQYLGY